jgi:hypothetical protein
MQLNRERPALIRFPVRHKHGPALGTHLVFIRHVGTAQRAGQRHPLFAGPHYVMIKSPQRHDLTLYLTPALARPT